MGVQFGDMLLGCRLAVTLVGFRLAATLLGFRVSVGCGVHGCDLLAFLALTGRKGLWTTYMRSPYNFLIMICFAIGLDERVGRFIDGS